MSELSALLRERLKEITEHEPGHNISLIFLPIANESGFTVRDKILLSGSLPLFMERIFALITLSVKRYLYHLMLRLQIHMRLWEFLTWRQEKLKYQVLLSAYNFQN